MINKNTIYVGCWNKVSGRLIISEIPESELNKTFSKDRIKRVYKSLLNNYGNIQFIKDGKRNCYSLISETSFNRYFSDYVVRKFKRK